MVQKGKFLILVLVGHWSLFLLLLHDHYFLGAFCCARVHVHYTLRSILLARIYAYNNHPPAGYYCAQLSKAAPNNADEYCFLKVEERKKNINRSFAREFVNASDTLIAKDEARIVFFLHICVEN